MYCRNSGHRRGRDDQLADQIDQFVEFLRLYPEVLHGLASAATQVLTSRGGAALCNIFRYR